MPYFVYRITPPRTLEHIDTLASFKEARNLTRAHRAELEPGGETSVRMIFAKDQIEAEKLLLTPRDERVIGED
ncbi:MAG: hypothetical protein PVF91_00900 [Chromatiales bacterium]|jgi:hypothetical protein